MTLTMLFLLLAAMLCASFLSASASAAEHGAADSVIEILPEGAVPRRPRAAHEASWYTEEAVYSRLMAMQAEYPEGMPWTNDNSYANTYLWMGGQYDGYNVTYTGLGCVAFGLIMSDAAFGTDLPLYQQYDVSVATVRVGDILRLNNDTHSVVVLQVRSDSVTIAEGNYNRSIHWGRTLSAAQVAAADYLLTRWPGAPQPPSSFTVSYNANGGTGAPASQTKNRGVTLTLSAARPRRTGYFFLGWAEYADAESPVYQPGGSYDRDEAVTFYAVWASPDFVLPASLTVIEEEAFAGGKFRFVKLSENTRSIGRRAFAGCRPLTYIYIPASTTSIDPTAFSGSPVTILGQSGSAAEAFAQNNHISFIAVS